MHPTVAANQQHRTDYTCQIKPAGGDDWTVQSISGLDS